MFQFSPPPADAATLVSATHAEGSQFVPILVADSSSSAVVGKLFNGLLKYTPELKLAGDLAESFEILDEGRHIVFNLRQDVYWHDGERFTAEDVLFTYQSLVDPNVPTPHGGDFKLVTDIKAEGDYKVHVFYAEAFVPALSSWTMWIMPEHLLKGENLITTHFSAHPIGTGPFKFHKRLPGRRVELIANKNYYAEEVTLDRIVMRVIPDQTTAFLELYQQTVDAAGLSPLQYTRQTDDDFFKVNYSKFKTPQMGYTFLAFNLNKEPFNDPDLRLAFDLAIDKKEIIDSVLMGLGREVTGPFLIESWAYNPDVSPRVHNPDKAKEILMNAGWRLKDGALVKDGKELKFNLTVNQGNRERMLVAQIIQKRLSQIGVKVRIEVLEWSVFVNKILAQPDYDSVLLAWSLSPDPDPYPIWHSARAVAGGYNFTGFKDSEVDGWIDEARKDFDADRRKELYHRIHQRIYESNAYLFLFQSDALPIIHRRFKGVDITPLGWSYNVEEWKVDKRDERYPMFRA